MTSKGNFMVSIFARLGKIANFVAQ